MSDLEFYVNGKCIATVGKIEGPRIQNESIDVTPARPFFDVDYDPRLRAGMLIKATLPSGEERFYTIVELSSMTGSQIRLVLQRCSPR